MSPIPTDLLNLAVALTLCATAMAAEGYRPTEPRPLRPGEVGVDAPGTYAEPGTTYVLTADVEAPASGILLGADTTLDLNGHTLTFAAAPYQRIPNGSFERGLESWDVTGAPGARVEDRRWRGPIDGDHVCRLPAGQELVSQAIELPVADRPYYAMVAVADRESAVDVIVEDENGRQVRCEYRFGDQVRQTCPELGRSPKLGGGVVFALLFNQPAGHYRLRVRAAEGDCVIDDADIRPALDYGIGVVGKILPWAYYRCILDGDDCAFFDLDRNAYPDRVAPVVDGAGKVVIRNGTIRAGAVGIRTWGVLCTADACRVDLDNVEVISAGVNTMAARIPAGEITRCRTELDWSWIIDRHRQGDYGIAVTGGAEPSRVADCEFVGGQGQLTLRGPGSVIERCLLVNRQNVTNHYSLGVGSGVTVRENRILPERGSGILVGRASGVDIVDNEIVVSASEPINEYGTEDYSVNAIRFTDYNAAPDHKRGANHGNRIRGNRIRVIGRSFPQADPGYRAMAYGIFMSVGGGDNEIADNQFVVEQHGEPPANGGLNACAIFVGGSDQGGTYHHNRIVSDVTPVWLGTYYGHAAGVTMHDNIFVRAEGAASYPPVRLGWHTHPARDIGFYSNRFEGLEFVPLIGDASNGYRSSYTFGWTLRVRAPAGAVVVVTDADGAEVDRGETGADGTWLARLAQYHARGDGAEDRIVRTDVSTYRVTVGDDTRAVVMDRDQELQFDH